MEEQKYYLVPITSKGVKFEDTSLMDMLNTVDPELGMREAYKLELKYGFFDLSRDEMVAQKKEASRISKENSAAFKSKHLPEKIVVVKKKNNLYELATMLPITALNGSYLDVFRTTGEKVVDYFLNNEDYSECATNLFYGLISKEKNFEIVNKIK